MFKLNICRNKLLKIFTVLCFISLPSLSFSKGDIEKSEELMVGTWFLSFTDNAPHTDRIEINEIATASNGEALPIGKYYPDQTGNGSNFGCVDATQENSSPVYICFISITPDVNVVISMFIHENNVVTGFIGNGQTLEIAREDMLSLKTPLTGLRVSETSANYEDNSGELYIPSVEYKGNFYQVTLKDQGNFVFEIKDASPAN